MTKPVHESELGKAFWNNVRVENISCSLFETSDGEGPPQRALQMGPYVRPQNPLESSMTRTGRVCLQFHVKGAPESSVLQLKVGWTYVQHGQNRDSMLGKIMEPEVVQILALLKQLKIPSSERQSAEKLMKCQKIAEEALSLLQGRVPSENNPTDQVHIIVKLHRVRTPKEKREGWIDGNASDSVFLKGRRGTRYWRTFPQFLAFDEFALMTHHKTSGNLFPVTRRSVLVTEAKGDGTALGKFISDRLANITSRFSSEKETMQLVFKAFKFILQVQIHHLETEGAFLADLHENNITVMSDGNGGPLDVQFAFVDVSGLLIVKGPKRARKDHIKAHLWCFLSIWSIVRVDKGHRSHLSAYATQVWVKIQKTAEECSQNFRRDAGWMPEQILQGLQRDVNDIQQRFLDGVSMQDQCRQMKQEAIQAAISRQFRKETVWEDTWNPPSIPPWDQGRVPARPGEGRVPAKEGRVPFPHGTPPRQAVVQQKARPRPLPPATPPPWAQQGQVPEPKPLKKAPPVPRVVKPEPMPRKAPPAFFVVAQQQGQQGPPTFAQGPRQAWILQKAPPPELPKEAKKPPPTPPPEKIQQQQPAQVVQPVKKAPPPPPPQEIQQQQPAEVVQQVKKPPPPPPPQRLPPSELNTDRFAISPMETPRPSQAPGPPPPAAGQNMGPASPKPSLEGRVPRPPDHPPPGYYDEEQQQKKGRVPMPPSYPPPGYSQEQQQGHGGKTKNDDREAAAMSEEPPIKKPSHGSVGKQGPSGSSGSAAPAAAGERQSATFEQFQAYQQRAKGTGQTIGQAIGKGIGKGIGKAIGEPVGKGLGGGDVPNIPENIKTAAGLWLDQSVPERDENEMDVEEGSMEDAAMRNPDEEDYVNVAVPEHDYEDLDEQQDHSMDGEYVNVPLDDDDAKSDATTVRLGDHLRKSPAAVAEDQASGSNDSIARNLGAALGERLKLQSSAPARLDMVPESSELKPGAAVDEGWGGPPQDRVPSGPKGRVPNVPEGRVPTGKAATTVREAKSQVFQAAPVTTMVQTGLSLKRCSQIARLSRQPPEGEVFDPYHNNRKFNTETCTVLIQMLYAVHEVSITECYRQQLPLDKNAGEFDRFKSKGGKLSLLWNFLQKQGITEIQDQSEPAEWHLWLTRDVALTVIRQLLEFMFTVKVPQWNDYVEGHKNWAMGQLRWHKASDELIKRCSPMDIYTKYLYKPQDLNSFIMPLSGMIWKAFNNTILCFCLKTIQEGERRAAANGGTSDPSQQAVLSLRDPPPESDSSSLEERYEKGDEPYFDSFILVSNVAPVTPVEATAFFSIPDWGSTADGYD